MLATFLSARSRLRLATGLLIAAATVVSIIPGASAAAEAGVVHFRCTNPASGATWPMVVDLDHRLVDSQPATITDRTISWPDPKQGFFDFDRATGKLQFRNPSSTGGYFLNYMCRPE